MRQKPEVKNNVMDVGLEQMREQTQLRGEKSGRGKNWSRAWQTAGKELCTEDWLRQRARVRDPRSGRVAAKMRSRDVTGIQDKVQDIVIFSRR